MNTFVSYIDSPVGTLELISSENGIRSLSFCDGRLSEDSSNLPEIHKSSIEQLNQYFTGTLKAFSQELIPEGTAFQMKVWHCLSKIPFGSTVSYGTVAESLGDPAAIRAVASAIGKNKIAIIIPCHRVIGSDGAMTGFAGGIPRKEWLLQHECALPQLTLFSGYGI